jgi:hypothetical protein
MASLRNAATCLGLTGNISIIQDFFGYRIRFRLQLSVRTQLRLLQGKHIHLNLIRTASFDVSQQQEIDYALHTMRNIYATVNMGVGRIQRFFIPPGHEIIHGDTGAKELWNDFSVRNASIDVFLARVIFGADGKSPTPGSCDKDSKNDSGCVIDVEDNADGSGYTLGLAIAHEVGHFLGLKHVIELHVLASFNFPANLVNDLQRNLMYPTLPCGGMLSAGQGGVMALHCSVHGGCPT